jgi:ABC-2 type transport system permease protein
MKTLLKLTWANIKMYARDRTALIWTLLFPFMIISIFGLLDFNQAPTSKIGMVYGSETTSYAKGIEEALDNIGNYKIEKGELDNERKALKEDDRLLVLELEPATESSKVSVKAYLNKASEASAQSTFLVVQNVLSQMDLQLNQVESNFELSSEVVNVNNLRNIDFTVPGVIAMSLMQGGLFGVIGTIVNYREKDILKRLFATPLSKSNFLIAQILSRLVISILQVVILLTSSYLVFDLRIVGSIWLVALLCILGSITFLGLGFAISGMAKTGEAARAIISPVQLIMMFTSGVYFPRDLLPDWLYDITAYTPLTYLADGLRDVMTRGYSLLDSETRTATIGVSVWLVIFVVLAISTFKWERE